MALVTFDLETFVDDGGLLVILIVATALFAIQTFATYVLWKRGDDKYKLRFISLLIASIALFIGLIAEIQVVIKGGSEALFIMGLVVFMGAIPIAAGLQIFLFIRDTWLKKEEKA
jgi:uncharacterized membrane protein